MAKEAYPYRDEFYICSLSARVDLCSPDTTKEIGVNVLTSRGDTGRGIFQVIVAIRSERLPKQFLRRSENGRGFKA
jgi:hypothetical protein